VRAVTLAALACAAFAFAAQPVRAQPSGTRAHYLELAREGIANARRHWWNDELHWYNDSLRDQGRPPLATLWSIAPLFEAVDAVAIAEPSRQSLAAVRAFARQAELYWNPAIRGYAAYPNPDGGGPVWFDDNAWWGIAFVDAYRATKDRRYLDDAARASRFIAKQGWDADAGGVWWWTLHGSHSVEALAGAAALAAELYEQTGRPEYRDAAWRYIRWGDKHNWRQKVRARHGILTDVDGAIIGARLALCRAGDTGACDGAEHFARAAYRDWGGRTPTQAPRYDTILFRYVLELAAYDHDSRWYEWAARAARSAETRALTADRLYLRFWDGSRPSSHRSRSSGSALREGLIQTHAAAVELFGWLAAVESPPRQ
jgi:hypothetical protein